MAVWVQRQYFSTPTSMGILRLKDNEAYRNSRTEFDTYIPAFLEDIAELFNTIEDPSTEIH